MTRSPSHYFRTFLTSERALDRRFREGSRRMAWRSGDPVRWAARARARFADLLGLPRFRKCPPAPRRLGAVRLGGGLMREEWRLQTERDVWMPFYLFLPEKREGRLPAVICAHGHGSAGKWATAGRRDLPVMRPIIRQFNYDYGLQLARKGFVTACPDARGFGERREPALQNDRTESEAFKNSSCHHLTLSGAPLGLTVQGMWAWDLMRLLDFLECHPCVDAERLGCVGLSGGGLQTLDLAALDLRVKAAVVSGYFYGARESLLVMNNNCMCNMVPGLWENFDMGDVGALIAPRGLFIETGDRDPLNGAGGVANVRSQVRLARRVYAALGKPRELVHGVFHGNHRWDGTRALPWLCRQLACGAR
ncbi:MAG: acetylxylan esterase [Verrucomicrobiae bacterium]|nr:acetylxylan esterase [Verrucomicrobiae bacterium]